MPEAPQNRQPASRPRTRRGQDTRNAILRAAEAVIGDSGFAAASIADITRKAGIAQGTFYIYFQSKDEVFRELVLEMGKLTRAFLADAVADAPDRLTAERRGLRAFLGFVSERPTLYNIVMEARFVAPDAYRTYYTTFARGYAQNLAAAVKEGEIREGDAETRAWALMGMAITLGERFAIWEGEADLDAVVAEVFDMLERGLRQ
ncbi:TetR/AcrR family transcriptional regulator [Pararhodobacter sp. CCB-MM2]|uniref:TetR/AcrR family transcriptional regulator n=1 Tax=Pararhodobacter sp. CCB-MM2 TaxID=1786003 RepID=UPI000832E5FC|nr:TetR/AcrR family transcriptional regulator [Pararhodobacter sp. CCB-MM2]MCA2011647.1 TetR/AcrR family transcriptional regulator [Cereibacter sphaeroides]